LSLRAARCPQCKQELPAESPFFPFCSKRCKLLDLGAWAAERYRVAAIEQNDEVSEKNVAEKDQEEPFRKD